MKTICAALLTVFAMPAAASISVADLTKLYGVTNDAYGDNFYSVNEASINEAISFYSYGNKRTVGFVETIFDYSTALAFRRTFKGAPQIDHFYTTRIDDFSLAISYGYADEGYEGVLRTSQSTGSVPLYRLSRFDPASGDVMHWYGIDATERAAFLQSGWADEGVEGYMWPNPTPNVNMQGGSATAYAYSVSGNVYIRARSVTEPGQPAAFGSCGGKANVYRDGQLVLTITNFSYGVLPGYFSVYDCYASVPAAPSGTYTYRVEFTGYSAQVHSATYGDYVTIIAPYTSEGALSN